MHIAKLLPLLFLFTSFVGIAQSKTLTKEEIITFKTGVAQNAASSKTISGEFIQKKQLAFLQNEIKSTGHFYFMSPDKIKWAYLEPYQYSVIFKNNTLYINDEGKKSSVDLGSNALFEKLNGLIVNSINGKMLESEDFKITYTETNEHYIANLLPINEVILKLFKEIVLSFDKSDFMIYRVKLIGPSGDYTQIFFKELKINAPIDDSVFEF